MNRSLTALFALTVALSACSRGTPETADPTPTKEVIAGVEMIDFDSEQGAFSCRAPRLWGIRAEKIKKSDAVVFIGPRDPETAGGSYITILKYPDSAPQYADAEKYAETFWTIDPKMKQPALERRKIGDKIVIFFHQERPFYKLHSHTVEYRLRHDYALIPIKGGFFEIEHRAPATAYEKTLPIFEAVVKSFQPKS